MGGIIVMAAVVAEKESFLRLADDGDWLCANSPEPSSLAECMASWA